MAGNRKIEHVQILKSKFSLEDKHVWFGRARLLADRIILKGLGYSKKIMLSSVSEVRWSADILVIECEDGDSVEMIIQSAALWKYELQARCGLKDVVAGPEADTVAEDQKDSDQLEFDLKPEVVQKESAYRVRTAYAQDRPRSDGR